MRPRLWIALGALGLLAALAVALAYLRLSMRDDAPVDLPDSPDTPAMHAMAPQPWQGSFDAHRLQLETAAAAGDPDAAFRMGETIAYCMNYRPIADADMTRMMAEVIARAGTSIRIGDRALADERSVDLLLFGQDEGRRRCSDTDSLRASPPALDAYAYISQAAQTGHTGAMAMYADIAFREFKTPLALIAQADEVEKRRVIARTYLTRAIAAGEPEALLAASKAYADDGWLERDPERALAYWLAYSATDGYSRIPERLAGERMQALQSMASPPQREAAAKHAEALIHRYRGQLHAH